MDNLHTRFVIVPFELCVECRLGSHTLETIRLKIDKYSEECFSTYSLTIFRSKEEKQERWNVYVQWACAGRPLRTAGARQGSFCCSRCTYPRKDCAVRVDHGNVGSDMLKV